MSLARPHGAADLIASRIPPGQVERRHRSNGKRGREEKGALGCLVDFTQRGCWLHPNSAKLWSKMLKIIKKTSQIEQKRLQNDQKWPQRAQEGQGQKKRPERQGVAPHFNEKYPPRGNPKGPPKGTKNHQKSEKIGSRIDFLLQRLQESIFHRFLHKKIQKNVKKHWKHDRDPRSRVLRFRTVARTGVRFLRIPPFKEL